MPEHFPTAGIDPIDTPQRALRVIGHAMADPVRTQTIVVLIDHESTGSVIAVVDHRDDRAINRRDAEHALDEVIEVARVFAGAAARSRQRQQIIASIRPAGSMVASDLSRWGELARTVAECGAHLREWFVIGDEVQYPRAAVGDGSRWPA